MKKENPLGKSGGAGSSELSGMQRETSLEVRKLGQRLEPVTP